MNSVPKVLTVPRQPHTRSMSNASSSKQQQHQQRGRGNGGDTNSRGSYRNGRGRQNGPAQYVHPGPMYHKPEQPASQNLSFGSFGADDFGSTFYASKPSAAIASAISDGNSSAQVYQDGSDKVLKQHSQRGDFVVGVEAGVGHRGAAIQAILVEIGRMAMQMHMPLPQ